MKFEKISIFISIVLISILALGAVSAAEDFAADDVGEPASLDEVQTIDNTIRNDDVSYESTDIIVNDTGDSSDLDEIEFADSTKNSKSALGSNQLTEGELSFTQLETDISQAGNVLNLEHDYAFIPGVDSESYFFDGILISKDLTINGGGNSICGADAVRVFNVTSGTLTLNNVTICDGAAADGAGVYIGAGAKLDATSTSFKDNVATYSGGAIYTEGGQISLTNSVLDSNDVTDVSTNNDTGGAAIYAKNAQVTLTNTNVTNNGRKELDRTNNDLVNAVVNLENSNAIITGGLFENNTGIYGGAINAKGDNTTTLTVTGATFNNNKAYNGGAINLHDMVTVIDDSTFTNNLVVGPGSQGYYGSGGAIAVDGDGSFTLTDSTFTENQATGEGASGGAVHIGLVQNNTASISGCTFTDNTAVKMGDAIYNHGFLTLSQNTVTGDGAEIETVSKINTHVWVIVNDNTTIDVEYYDTIPIVVKITDDAGNLMRINATTLQIDLGDSWTRQTLTLDEDTGFYTMDAYLVDQKSGLLTPSRITLGNYFAYNANNNLKSTYINMIKATPTLELSYENVTKPNDVVININLIGKEGAPLISWSNTSATPFKITVNDEVYKVKITNGIGTVTIPDLAVGTYTINASWDGNTKYTGLEQLYELVVSEKPGTYRDLQYRIDHAEGDSLELPYPILYDAEYDGADFVDGIIINKTFTISGTGYVDGNFNLARIFKVTNGATLTLNGLYLTFGNAENGGAVYVDEGSTFIGNELTFISNKAINGGAIYSLGTVICDNETYFLSNTADNGGAIYSAGTASISKSKFIDNDPEQGGALYVAAGETVVNESTEFSRNSADNGGAVYVASGATFTADNVKFTENTATYRGGAIWSNGTVNVKDSSFDKNDITYRVKNDDNGGAAIFNNGTLNVDNSRFTNNLLDYVIRTGDDNHPELVDGVILSSGKAKISNSHFENNSGTYGSAITALPIGTTLSDLTVENCEFITNLAYCGAAIYVGSGTTLFYINECVFIGNNATGVGSNGYVATGGAIKIAKKATGIIADSQFYNNSAANGGAIDISATEGYDASVLIDSCVFGYNLADQGGVIYIDNRTTVNLYDSTLYSNEGEALNYHIFLNGDATLGYKGNNFYTTIPTIVAEDTYAYGETITINGTFDWGVNNKPIYMNYTINGAPGTAEVVDGNYTILIDGQPDVGDYTIVITTFADEDGNIYFVETAQKTISVTKATPILSVEGDEYLMPPSDDATVTISLTDKDGNGIKGTVIVTVAGETYLVDTDEDGDGELTIYDLPATTWTIDAKFIGNDNFNEVVNDTEEITFIADVAYFDIIIEDGVYGDKLTVIVENATDIDGNKLTGMVTGMISTDDDDISFIVYVNNGQGTNTTTTAGGVGKFTGDAYFYDSMMEFMSGPEECSAYVSPANATLYLVPWDADDLSSDIAYGDTIEFGAAVFGVNLEQLNGTVYYIITELNKKGEIAIVNGSGAVNLTDILDVGTYTVISYFVDDKGNYDPESAVNYTNFKVAKATPTLNVENAQQVYADTNTITFNVTGIDDKGVKGTVIAIKPISEDVSGAIYDPETGLGELTFNGLVVGDNPIVVKFLSDDDNYANAEKTINITITQATLAIDSTITTQEIVYGKDVEADVTVTGIVQEDTVIANVSLYDNATGELLDSFNIALGLEDSIAFEDLKVGDYYYTIEFTSELYAGDNFTSEVFTVNTAEILDLSSSNVDNVSYGEGIDITVYVDGMIEGDLIEVNFTVVDATTGDDVFNGTYNISNGDVITVPPLDIGKYSYSVSFYGDDKYNTGGADSIAAVGSFEVLDMSDVDVLVTADESITYGEKVTVEIDPIVSEGGLPVTGTATIYVYDDPASVDPVYVLADVELDKDGATAVLDTILPTGEYWIVVDFESDDGYYDGRGVTSTIVDLALAKLSIDPITVTYGETIPITVTALGNGGELLNGTVEFKIYGPGFEGTVTVKNGTGVTNITERFDVGTYTIIAAFGDDGANYEGFNITSLEITPATPIVSVTGSEVEYGEPNTVTVSVSDIDGMPLSGKVIVTVDWVVDGLTQVIDLDDSNEASFDLSPYVHQGTYDVTVTYIANGNYGEAVNDTETVNVTASTTATVNVEVPENVSYGDELTIKVTAEDGAGEQIPVEAVNVTVNGETKEYPVDENGTVNLGVLPAGENEIAVALNDGTHKPTETETTVKVAPAEAVVFVDADNDNPSYGDVVVVTVNATNKDKPIDADACLVVDGYLIGYYDLEDGQVEISIKDLAPGKHEIEVSVADGNYSEGSYGRAIVNVDKASPVITAEGETVEWGDVATVKVNATGANGEKLNIPLVVRVIWEVSGVDELIDLENGTGEAAFQISNYVAPGTYNVTVIFLGNDEYYPVNNTEAKITLTEPKTVEMDVSITPDEYGKATNVTVTLKDIASKPLEGSTVTVTVDGKEYANATIGEDGTVTIPVEGLEAGNHTIAVDFDDGEHSPVHEEENIAIEPSTDATVEATVNVGENETTVDVIVKDSTGEGINGTVIVYVDGEPVANTTVGNDTSSVSIGQLAPGDHTVDVEFVNPNYAPASYSTHVTESTLLTNMTVKVDKNNILYGESDITATIEFTSEGKALDGVVEVLLNGEAQNVTVTGGKATVKFSDLAADHYTVVSNFAGNATYAPSSDSANFVVERKATKFNYNDMNTTAVNPNVDGRIGEYFYFQLVDQDGKALANKSVSIGFNGKVYNRTTNETGWAKLQINLRIVFTYTFAISFLGDDNYTGAFNVALINVSAQTPKLSTSSKVYKASAKTKTLTAKLLTSSGNVDKGKKLTFTVNGKSYSATTNDKGVASVKVSISQKGTYSFTVKNAKDNTYASVSKTAKLVIK